MALIGCSADEDGEALHTTTQAVESGATVSSDYADYAPGEVATLSGNGWEPSETVQLEVACTNGMDDFQDVTADAAGAFTDVFYPITEEHLGTTCEVTATGQASTRVAHTTFTDGNVRVFAAPTGPSFALTYTLYASTNCSGSIVEQGGKLVQGTETVVAGTPQNHAVQLTESIKLTAAATSVAGTSFINWTSTSPSTPSAPTTSATICVPGFNGSGNRQYTANYAAPATNRPPTVTCTNVVRTTSSDSCAVAATVIASTSDPDGDAVTCTETPSGSFALGVTSVSVSCNDGRGGTAACSGTVTLSDDDAPQVSCPAPQTQECTSPSGASVQVSATATDNCAGALAADCGSSSVFPLGLTTGRCTATDGDGNTGACNYQVTVVDTTAPSIVCPAPAVAECTGNGAALVDPADASASDVCGGVTVSNPAPSSFPLGTTSIAYSAVDGAGHSAVCGSSVTVVDTIAPSITCPDDVTVECTGDHSATVDVASASAADVCTSATVSDPAPLAYPLGTTTVSQTATDASGNQNSCSSKVVVADTLPPSIDCPAPVTVECTANGAAVVDVAPASARDVCGAVTVSDPAAASYPLGTSAVAETATDDAGLVSTCGTSVTVVDTTAPTFSSIAPQTVVGSCDGAPVAFTMPTATDGCQTASVTCSALAGNSFGSNAVTCTATDPSGNTATTTISVTVLQPLQIAFASPLADDNMPDNIETDADVANIFTVKSTIPHQVRLLSCSGADVTTSVAVTVKIAVVLKDGAAAQSDTNVVTAYTGVGDAGGLMALVDGKYKYNLKTTGYKAGTAASSQYFESIITVNYTSAPSFVVATEDARLESK